MTGAFPLQPARGSGTTPADAAGVRVPVPGHVLERVTDETWLVAVAGNRITIQTPESLEPGARVLVLLATRDADAVIVRPRVPAESGVPSGDDAGLQREDAVPSNAVATLPILLGALANTGRPSTPASAAQLMASILQLVRDGHVPESLARRLLALLTPPSMEGDSRTIGTSIQQQVEHGGVLLEGQIARALTQGAVDSARLAADLRSVLGQIVATLESVGENTTNARQTSVSAAVAAARDLAGDALVAQLQTAADVTRHGTWRFDLSLMLSGRAVPAPIEWEPDRDTRPGGRGPASRGRVSVFVDVAASGIEARIAWSPSTLQVDLFAGSDAVRDRLSGAMETLTATLSALGFLHIVANAWTNPARLARWRLGASPDTPGDTRVFEVEA